MVLLLFDYFQVQRQVFVAVDQAKDQVTDTGQTTRLYLEITADQPKFDLKLNLPKSQSILNVLSFI